MCGLFLVCNIQQDLFLFLGPSQDHHYGCRCQLFSNKEGQTSKKISKMAA